MLICDDNDAIRRLLGTIVANDPGLRVEEVMALGAASYVEKGADPAAIVAAIRQTLAPPSLTTPAVRS